MRQTGSSGPVDVVCSLRLHYEGHGGTPKQPSEGSVLQRNLCVTVVRL